MYDTVTRQGVANTIDKITKVGAESVQRRAEMYAAVPSTISPCAPSPLPALWLPPSLIHSVHRRLPDLDPPAVLPRWRAGVVIVLGRPEAQARALAGRAAVLWQHARARRAARQGRRPSRSTAVESAEHRRWRAARQADVRRREPALEPRGCHVERRREA
eukprot:7388398-Prymnesium_polylepis.1